MKKPKTNQYFMLLLNLLLLSSCQNKEQQNTKGEDKKQDHNYEPKKSRLLIVNELANPELNSVTLFRDDEKDSLTSVRPENGKFKLDVNAIAVNEVYFLRLTGKSTKRGTSGLNWEEEVPFLATSSGELTLVQQTFNHIGSISKVKFSVHGGGEEQELLNNWHAALVELEATEEAQVEEYSLGGSSAIKIAGKKTLAKSPASITEDFISQHKPLISSFYLISRIAKQRQHTTDYQMLLDQAPKSVKDSKYALDLAKRLAQIQTKVKQLDLEKQVVATDTHLSEIPWESFKDRKYLLLSFWNSSDGPSTEIAKKLMNAAPKLTPKGIDVLLISMENRFTKWQKTAKGLDFKYNYKMRNEAQQALINTLYLSELPRLVLVKPNGEVINDDLSLEQVKELE